MYKFSVCVCLVVVLVFGDVFGAPAKDELMFEGPDDTATVESTVREARAAPSHIGDLVKPGVKDAFLYVYGDAENDEGDVHGYSKKMNDKGKDGYRHFDSFHKRDGDKYGYEKHSEFGRANKAGIEAENDKAYKQAHSEADGGKKDKDGAESKKSFSVFGEFNEDDKKQAKKKIESDYYGEGDGGYGNSEGNDGEAEGAESSESSEGDDGDGESEGYEVTEENDEGEEGSDY